MIRRTWPGRIALLGDTCAGHPTGALGIFDTPQLISPDAFFDDMLASRTGLGVQEIGFIGTKTNDKEPGSTEACCVPQVPNGIYFRMTHFGSSHVGEAILARGEHFAPLTDEGHMMVCVMPRHVPTLLRIDERVKMTMQPSGEHRTC